MHIGCPTKNQGEGSKGLSRSQNKAGKTSQGRDNHQRLVHVDWLASSDLIMLLVRRTHKSAPEYSKFIIQTSSTNESLKQSPWQQLQTLLCTCPCPFQELQHGP